MHNIMPGENRTECSVAVRSWCGFVVNTLAIAVVAPANASTKDSFSYFRNHPMNVGALGGWLSLSCTPDTIALTHSLYCGPDHLLPCFVKHTFKFFPIIYFFTCASFFPLSFRLFLLNHSLSPELVALSFLSDYNGVCLLPLK